MAEAGEQAIGASGLAEAFAAVARAHGRTLDPSDISRRLPYDQHGMTLVGLQACAPELGFECHVARAPLSSLPAVALPVIAFDQDGLAIVIAALSRRRRVARILVPATGAVEKTVALGELEAQLSDIIVRLEPSPHADAATGASGPPRRRGHWFWSTVARFKSDYAEVALAALLINLVGLATPVFVRNVYDRVIPNLAMPTLWALTAGVAIAIVLDLMLRGLRSRLVDATGRRVDLAVAGRVFEHILRLRLERRPGSAGALASQLRDFDSVRDVMTSSTLIAVTDLAFMGVFLAALWIYVGPLMLVPLAAVVVVLVMAVVVQVPLARAITASQGDNARRQGLLVEAAGSIETIKSLGAESMFSAAFNRAVAATSQSAARARFWANLSAHAVSFVSQLVTIVTIVWGVYLVLDGSITVGALIATSILSGRVLAPLGSIVQTLARVQQARTAYGTLDALMAAPAEPAASSDGRAARHGEIALSGVALTYPGAAGPALVDIDLRIAAGERVGLIGRVGSGKSSIGRLLAALYQPSAGQVLIDGMDVRQFGADIRTLVGYCPQEPELFAGTIRDNIVIGRPDASAEEIERAVRITGIDNFAARLPAGLATPVAERGRSLSGGQRQAIGLARALIRRPRVLFLDEPSSAMDTPSERALVTALRRELEPDTTLLIATHRDGLLDIVDRLLVLEGGRIVMDGAKDEVLSRLRAAARQPVAVRSGTS